VRPHGADSSDQEGEESWVVGLGDHRADPDAVVVHHFHHALERRENRKAVWLEERNNKKKETKIKQRVAG